jgi:hypothetical protein
MINKITSFFTQQRKNILLYFEDDKSESISVEITPEKTISQLYVENINQISAINAKIFLKKKSYLPNNQQRKEHCFLLISKNDPYIRIKLKKQIIPWKILTRINNSSYSLFYILNDNYYYSYENNGINCRLNNLIKNKSQNEPKDNKPLSDETRIINFVSPENKIFDGEIEKFSYTDKRFKNKFVYIDNNKLMYKDAASTYQKLFKTNKSNSPYNESNYIRSSDDDIYDTENLWNIIPLSTINSINVNNLNDLEALDIDIKKYSERLIVLRTIKKERLILRANNRYMRDKWFEIINDIVEQAHIDKYFYQYNNKINEATKNLYLTKLKLVYKMLNLKGVLVLKETRKIFFEIFDNEILHKIVEFCVEYKLNIIKKNDFKSYEQITNLVEFLGIKNFNEDKQIISDSDSLSNEIEDENFDYINKDYILKYLIDEETHSKLTNIYQALRQSTLSFKGGGSNFSCNQTIRSSNFSIINEDNLYNKIVKNCLSKKNKKKIKNNDQNILGKLSKINAIQFCKHNNFNANNMSLFCENEKEDHINQDVFSDLGVFL